MEAYARNHKIAIEWAGKGVRKEDYVLPALRRMEKKNAYGVYFIFKSMEQGRTFRMSIPKFPTQDPNHRILAQQRSRFTHYYFYIRDEVLGHLFAWPRFSRSRPPTVFHGHSFMERELQRREIGFRKNDNAFLATDHIWRVASRRRPAQPRSDPQATGLLDLPRGPKFSKKERADEPVAVLRYPQIEYCRNFIFKRHFPIHKIFERCCEFGLWRLTAHRISEIFGVRLDKRLRGNSHRHRTDRARPPRFSGLLETRVP